MRASILRRQLHQEETEQYQDAYNQAHGNAQAQVEGRSGRPEAWNHGPREEQAAGTAPKVGIVVDAEALVKYLRADAD